MSLNPEQEAALIALEKRGRLTPDQVVSAAEPAESVLHPLFEWDDADAADRYRLDQARGIIRSVYVRIVLEPERVVRAVRYVHDPRIPSGGQGYVAIGSPMSIEDQHLVAAAEASRALSLMRRAVTIAEALGLANGGPDLVTSWVAWRDELLDAADPDADDQKQGAA